MKEIRLEEIFKRPNTRIPLLRLIFSAHKKLSSPEVAEKLGISGSGARHQMMALEGLHILQSEKSGRFIHYYPNTSNPLCREIEALFVAEARAKTSNSSTTRQKGGPSDRTGTWTEGFSFGSGGR